MRKPRLRAIVRHSGGSEPQDEGRTAVRPQLVRERRSQPTKAVVVLSAELELEVPLDHIGGRLVDPILSDAVRQAEQLITEALRYYPYVNTERSPGANGINHPQLRLTYLDWMDWKAA